jgi:hypothetical protein
MKHKTSGILPEVFSFIGTRMNTDQADEHGLERKWPADRADHADKNKNESNATLAPKLQRRSR